MAAMGPLGIDRGDCDEKDQMQVAPGSTTTGQGRRLKPISTAWPVQLQAHFSDTPMILLGRSDFFAKFKVTFDQRSLRFVLETNT